MRVISPFIFILSFFLPLTLVAQDYVPGEVIVKLKSNTDQGQTHKFIGKVALSQKMSLKKSWGRFKMHQFKLGAGQDVEQAVNDLLLDPDVEFAEPNYIFGKQSTGIEGEPMSLAEVQESFSSEGGFSGSGFDQTSADINADEAWAILSSASDRPIVAVIDSGVDYNHYVFVDSGAIWSNDDEIPSNGIDDDGNGYIDDVRGWNFVSNTNDPMDDDNHGTHVAGIVLGMTQNILAPTLEPARVQIMPLKFLDHQGVGTTSDALEAINYAIANGAQVLNNSWGGGSYSQALHDVITTSYNSGLSFIAAAGNAANDNDAAPTYPASYEIPNVVSIAATSSGDNLASFSNFGASSVHVASPGISILSTLPNDSFGYSSGTSMAAPFAAGLSALMIREKGVINGYQVKGVLYEHSFGVSGLSGKVSSSARIDALEAVEFVQNNDIDSYQPDYSGGSRDIASTGSAGGGGCGMVMYKALKNGGQRGSGSGKPPGGTLLMLGLLFAPLFLANVLRIRKQKLIESRRKHQRFKIDSEVSIQVGGKKLVGQMNSISLGGAGIDTDAMLEKGGVVTLNISSPDGSKQVEVQGRVVWSEERKAYGVQFCDAKDDALATIGGWTKALSKAS
ncbi:MAG: S8 family serine peptidase [Pseudomonadota bacterium]